MSEEGRIVPIDNHCSHPSSESHNTAMAPAFDESETQCLPWALMSTVGLPSSASASIPNIEGPSLKSTVTSAMLNGLQRRLAPPQPVGSFWLLERGILYLSSLLIKTHFPRPGKGSMATMMLSG